MSLCVVHGTSRASTEQGIMKLNKACKLDKVVQSQLDRYPATQNVHLDVERRVAVATNGKTMAVVPVEVGEEDISGPVTVEALKAASGRCISANGTLAVVGGAAYPRPDPADIGDFPAWDRVVPKSDGTKAVVRLNIKLLWELAQGMGCQALELHVRGPAEAVLVRAAGGGATGKEPAELEAYGVIMPITS